MMRISKTTRQLTLDRTARAAARLTITPKLRLNPVDKKVLLSSILKFFFPGNWRIIRSTHIIEAVLH